MPIARGAASALQKTGGKGLPRPRPQPVAETRLAAYDGAMTDYKIIPAGDGTYNVEARGGIEVEMITTGFETETAAEQFIEQQRRKAGDVKGWSDTPDE